MTPVRVYMAKGTKQTDARFEHLIFATDPKHMMELLLVAIDSDQVGTLEVTDHGALTDIPGYELLRGSSNAD